MRPLSADALVAVWERGEAEHPLERALTLLRLAQPNATRRALAQLPLGQRNAGLLQLRADLFGPTAASIDRCPKCGEAVSFEIEIPRVLAAAPPPPPPSALGLHPLTSEDLAASARCASVAEATQLLTARCLGRRASDEVVSAAEIERLATELEALDPLAEITFALTCPRCAAGWQAWFDPAEFLWTELAAEGRRILEEVDLLARAYGWNENEILALSPFRRARYLQLCEAK